MRVAVIHNLGMGGARRRLGEHLARLDAEVFELCPASATPITADAEVFPFGPVAPRHARPLRAPFRYTDLRSLLRVWSGIAARVVELGVDAVYANPCRYLQAPAALLHSLPASLYFCDEPRRVDIEPAARATRNPLTWPVYAPMYRAERRADRAAVGRATQVATNSRYTAAQIHRAYGREAELVPMGVADPFLAARPKPPEHILSVGTLIPSKGHDLAIESVARSGVSWPLVVVAPGPDAAEESRLHAIARDAGVRLGVRIGISDSELADEYAQALATLYLAQNEPFGLVSLEAQAAGSPVIVSAEGGLPETLGVGWAVPRDPDAVAAKLGDLQRASVRDAMVEAGRKHAAGLSWDRSARAIEALLRLLAGFEVGR